MTNPAVMGGASVAMVAEAKKAIGGVVFVEAEVFLDILRKTDRPLVVHSPSGFLTQYKYLTSYRGLVFFTKSKEALQLPVSAEVIAAKKISMPEI